MQVLPLNVSTTLTGLKYYYDDDTLYAAEDVGPGWVQRGRLHERFSAWIFCFK